MAKQSELTEYHVLRMEKPQWSLIPAVTLQHMPWLPPNEVSASAQLCHNGHTIFLRMEAHEAEIRASLTGPLEQVCNDSCLEFFFAPLRNDRRYFNFECNPLGTLYLGFGAERPTRVRQIVKSTSLFDINPFFLDDGWGLTMSIPLPFLQLYFPDMILNGIVCAGNFYKCGDQTTSPHYLAWSPLTSEQPDYHRRGDFGLLHFE